jgi:protease I
LNKTFDKVSPEEYDAVYIVGGRGPEYIRIDKRVQYIVRHFHQTEKPIFTICHGVQVLMAVDGVLKGRRVAALQYCEPEVRLAGGVYVDVEPTGACADGNLVSAKGWPGARSLHARMPDRARDYHPSWRNREGVGSEGRLKLPAQASPGKGRSSAPSAF